MSLCGQKKNQSYKGGLNVKDSGQESSPSLGGFAGHLWIDGQNGAKGDSAGLSRKGAGH